MAGPRSRVRFRGRDFVRNGVIWAPSSYANTTFLWDSKTTPYTGAGSITPDISTPGANPLTLKFAGQPAADGGGILFTGDGTKSGFNATSHATSEYISGLNGTFRAGTLFAIIKPSSATSTAYSTATPYTNDIAWGPMTQGVLGIGAANNAGVGVCAHVYDGLGGYLPFFKLVTADAYHVIVLRWTAVNGGGGGHVDFSVDGGLSGSGNYQTNNGMADGLPDGYTTPAAGAWPHIGFIYNAASDAQQQFKGTVGLVGMTNDVVPDSFITNLYTYAKSNYGVA